MLNNAAIKIFMIFLLKKTKKKSILNISVIYLLLQSNKQS